MNKILLIEDEVRVASVLKKGLEEQGFEVKLAYDGAVGEKTAIEEEFDLVILDVNLPTKNGYEVCKGIREANEFLPILMLTALGAKDDKLSGFGVGADDYIVKPFEFKELFARIQVFLRRTSTPMPSRILSIEDLTLNLDSKIATRGGKKIELTAKEYLLLELLMKNKDTVVSKQKILEAIWEVNSDTGTNVVEVFVNYLRKKVDKDYSRKLIKTKPGFGYYISNNE